MNSVLNDNDSSILANSINHFHYLEHNEKMSILYDESQMVLVKTYNLIPFKDGDQWCVLLGKDLQTGISGFGDTPMKAIIDFNKSFYRN